MDTNTTNKILIIGCPGSGKTFLAKKLHAITLLPVHHLDTYYWKKNWIEPHKEEWKKTLEELLNKSNWIIDGNYHNSLDIRFKKSNMIIFLDIRMSTCAYRILLRHVKEISRNNFIVEERPVGFIKKLMALTKLLIFVMGFNKKIKPIITQKITNYTLTNKVIVLKNNREIFQFLQYFTEIYKPHGNA